MEHGARRLQAAMTSAVMTLLAGAAALGQSEGTGGRCVPLSERAGRELSAATFLRVHVHHARKEDPSRRCASFRTV
jgi:hypothetical protein